MPKRSIAAIYEYRTHSGRLAFTKVRYDPKGFAYRGADGRAGLSGRLPKLLYRLPELLAADSRQPVFVVEGEKDVERLRLLGLVATCNPDGGGKGKWSTAYARHFRGRRVVIIPDNDPVGIDHAYDVARKLHRAAASVVVLSLPDLANKGDVSDWLDRGGTPEQLRELAGQVPPHKPQPEIELERRDEQFEFQIRWRLEQILRQQLTAQEKLLLIVLEAGLKRPTQQNIAAAMSLSPRRLKAMFADLRRRGIVRGTKKGRETTYRVCG
ncbi:MAG TPA: hypothetical protein VMP01_01125 [Pirellulaceae bacterium]|nr:hypothetical protein [Pirellulaceae bacterium]